MRLRPDESVLEARWLVVDGRVVGDPIADRIAALTTSVLRKLGSDESGWSTLYRDPEDGRLWELTYPQSEAHGGGPPRLQVISSQAALAKYGI